MTDLDTLAAENPVRPPACPDQCATGQARQLSKKRWAELSQLGLTRLRVEEAADRIRELKRVGQQNAQVPTSVVAGNIESWYRAREQEDRTGPPSGASWDGWMVGRRHRRAISTTPHQGRGQLPNPTAKASSTAAGSSSATCRAARRRTSRPSSPRRLMPAIGSSSSCPAFTTRSAQQTQDRLNTQLWEPHPELWNRLTNETDFRPTDNVDALLANQNQRVLAVVKKNGPRLRALRNWLRERGPETSRSCPILIIDDEADQASVNTAKPDTSAKPDQPADPRHRQRMLQRRHTSDTRRRHSRTS